MRELATWISHSVRLDSEFEGQVDGSVQSVCPLYNRFPSGLITLQVNSQANTG